MYAFIFRLTFLFLMFHCTYLFWTLLSLWLLVACFVTMIPAEITVTKCATSSQRWVMGNTLPTDTDWICIWKESCAILFLWYYVISFVGVMTVLYLFRLIDIYKQLLFLWITVTHSMLPQYSAFAMHMNDVFFSKTLLWKEVLMPD